MPKPNTESVDSTVAPVAPVAEPALRQDVSDAIDAFWIDNFLGADPWQWRLAQEKREALKSRLVTFFQG